MSYEPVYEEFEAIGPDGGQRSVRFRKAGFVAAGDQPELYFFDVDGEPVVVGLSGEVLREWQRANRSPSREERSDAVGLRLKREIESGRKVVTENLYIGKRELEGLLQGLRILT